VNHKSWVCLSAVSLTTMLLTSCGNNAANPPATNSSPSPSAAPAPTSAAPAPAAVATNSGQPANFSKPVVADSKTDAKAGNKDSKDGKDSKTAENKTESQKDPQGLARSIDTAAGLIAPTDADNWAKTVKRGRQDPFASLQVQGTPIATAPTATPTPSSPKVIKTAKIDKVDKTDAKVIKTAKIDKVDKTDAKVVKTAKIDRKNSSPVKIAKVNKTDKQDISKKADKTARNDKSIPLPPIPTVTADSSAPSKAKKVASTGKPSNPAKSAPTNTALRPVPMPLGTGKEAPAVVAPEPKLAKAVEVSGIIQAGGQTQVVIKLPTESFSRYVEVGDRLLDGKVLVKRIEGSNSLTPIVILEEVGVEVSRKVGDSGQALPKDSTPKAVDPK
jgi:hypothetical protein